MGVYRGPKVKGSMGWVVIGGRRIYFRSRWEKNIARYYERCKQLGEIHEWEGEGDVFWFEAIRRGVRSYKPDFKITRNNGSIYYVEVKGFMDSKSKTKLKRMRKYHPDIEVQLIDAAEYRLIEGVYSQLCPEWENMKSD